MTAVRPSSEDRTCRSDGTRPDRPSPGAEPGGSWISHEVEAMASAWSRGRRLLADEVIGRHPGLDDEAAVRLIYEEVNLRREAGEDVRTIEVVARYPRWKDELEILLGCDRMLRPMTAPAVSPDVGEQLGPFFLRAELGRGASGRTFLASEPTLADRPVVLKVLSDDQEEHLSLARLQHTNIIPLFSEHSFPERRLRALCMPYLGGASLARILEELAPIPPGDRRGSDIIRVLDRAQVVGAQPATIDQPYRRNLEKVSYVEAICWIGTRLADALEEAHAHGLVHMDVKPSNVLIAADGSAMLLDFHLAGRPLAAGERYPGRVGGTTGWMAPEQRAALEAVGRGEPIPSAVDHRADIYALGLLLAEALGLRPGPEAHGASLPSSPEVSTGLRDILARCTAPHPFDRYPRASAVADDLVRHLEHQPLRGVPNRSVPERWRKWRRRSPSALRQWTLWIASACLAACLAGIMVWNGSLGDEAGDDLREGRRLCAAGRYAEAVLTLRDGLDRAEASPAHRRLAEELRAQLRVAYRGQQAEVLHRLAERIRSRYGVDPPSGPEAEALLRNVRTIWENRDPLLSGGAARLAPAIEAQIRADLEELVAIWAEIKVRSAGHDEQADASREALAIVDKVREVCGRSFTIDRLRRDLARRLGRTDGSSGDESPPSSAYDHYDLGRSLLRAGDFEAAAEQFRLSLDRRPQDFWPNFYLGLCEYRLARFEAAVSAFSICIALEPARAENYFNRAMAEESIERTADALRDYGKALACNPGLTAARINRSILAYNAGRLDEALADLNQALPLASDPETRGRIRYNLALVHLEKGDRAAARDYAADAARAGVEEAWDIIRRLHEERGGASRMPGP